MMKKLFLVWITLLMVMAVQGQNERKAIRQGVKEYEEGKFSEAEVEFRKAQSMNQESFEAEFNTGAALYGQKKYEETVKQYRSLLPSTDDADKEARIWHNIGNSLLEAQQYGPSIEAYKNSLRNDPTDDDTRYNLAYAKQKLIEQQQQQNQQSDQDQDQQEKQQQEQDRDQDQPQDRDQDQPQDRDQDQPQDRDQDRDQDQDQQDQQSAPRDISKEDAERMLRAIQQQEKEVKEKVDREKAAAAKVKPEKDW